MPQQGIYVKILDSNSLSNYPSFLNYQNYYYEKTISPGPGRTPETTYLTLLSSVTGFNTLEAVIVATANEASLEFEAPVSIYAYYDI